MKDRHPISDNPRPRPTIAFWQDVRALICGIWTMFGGPEDIAACRALNRKDHRFLADLLRGLEIILRKLLLLDACDLRLAPCAPAHRTGGKNAARQSAPRQEIALDHPESWRVAFRLGAVRGDHVSITKSAVSAPRSSAHKLLFASYPLAARFEAALRVFDAPELYVKRMARLLAKQPQIACVLAQIPKNLPPHAGLPMMHDMAEPLAAIFGVAPALNSS